MLGLKKQIKCFSDDEKRVIIEDYLQSGLTKQAIWKKYVGYEEEHGSLLRWMRKLGYIHDSKQKDAIFVFEKASMNKPPKSKDSNSFSEHTRLEQRILELEKQLQESELKTLAYQTMIDVAERELNISIKKKFNTKPLKK